MSEAQPAEAGTPIELGDAEVMVDDEHLWISRQPSAYDRWCSARIPLLALTRLRVGSGGRGFLRSTTVAQIRVWNGPDLDLRVSRSEDEISRQRQGLVAAADAVAWNNLMFPMSSARAEGVRRRLSGADIPAALPGLTPLFRSEFLTPLDKLPDPFLEAWRSARPDIGRVEATLTGRGGVYLVLGREGVAVGSEGQGIKWDRYSHIGLPAGAVSDTELTLVVRSIDGELVGLVVLDVDASGLGLALRSLTRRVIQATLRDLPDVRLDRLAWAQAQFEAGTFDDATLALAVQLILDPKAAAGLTDPGPQYPPLKAPQAAPQAAPAPAPSRVSAPQPQQPAQLRRQPTAAQQIRGVAMLASLAAAALGGDE